MILLDVKGNLQHALRTACVALHCNFTAKCTIVDSKNSFLGFYDFWKLRIYIKTLKLYFKHFGQNTTKWRAKCKKLISS